MAVDHYENFPVASWLCPPALRPAVVAIYRFARTADDLADEGDEPAPRRLLALANYRLALELAVAGQPDPRQRWPEVFRPLRQALARHRLDPSLLEALLSAFEQDVRNPVYETREQLLDYCRRSADPVGRLLLQLYGVDDVASLQRSDGVCTALQLVNFWQDLGRDLARGRCYVPRQDLARHGLAPVGLRPGADTPATRALVKDLCDWAEALMLQGAPLALTLPGRAGWELRFVVQGGLRILAKIRAMDHACLSCRPVISAWDLPRLAWGAVAVREAGRP